MNYTPEQMEEIADKAQEAFWAKVVELVPDADSGDFPPEASLWFDMSCRSAVKIWIEGNVRFA